jgi:hypothetical protein
MRVEASSTSRGCLSSEKKRYITMRKLPISPQPKAIGCEGPENNCLYQKQESHAVLHKPSSLESINGAKNDSSQAVSNDKIHKFSKSTHNIRYSSVRSHLPFKEEFGQPKENKPNQKVQQLTDQEPKAVHVSLGRNINLKKSHMYTDKFSPPNNTSLDNPSLIHSPRKRSTTARKYSPIQDVSSSHEDKESSTSDIEPWPSSSPQETMVNNAHKVASLTNDKKRKASTNDSSIGETEYKPLLKKPILIKDSMEKNISKLHSVRFSCKENKLLDVAVNCYKEDNVEGCISILQIILKREPDHTSAWNLLSNCNLKLYDCENASKLVLNAINRSPDNKSHQALKKAIVTQQQKIEDAILERNETVFDDSIFETTNITHKITLLFLKLEHCQQIGNLKKALEVANIIISYNRENQVKALYQKAKIMYLTGEADTALEYCNLLEERADRSTNLYLLKSLILYKQEKFKQAREYQATALIPYAFKSDIEAKTILTKFNNEIIRLEEIYRMNN